MRRYPLWKHALIWGLLAVGGLYALPSVFQTLPTIEIRARGDSELAGLADEAEKAMRGANMAGVPELRGNTLAVFAFSGSEAQLAAFSLLRQQFAGRAIVALGSKSTAPGWLADFGARPVALGLDLRGGAQFLLEVDVGFVIDRFWEAALLNIRAALRKEKIRLASSDVDGRVLALRLADPQRAGDALALLQAAEPRVSYQDFGDGLLRAELEDHQLDAIAELAVGQNAETLRRRVDEIGVAEPVIARQGSTRVLVQLPGLQDTARAKGILGRRAALELRGVNELLSASPSAVSNAKRGAPPVGTQLFMTSDGEPILLESRDVVTGENIVDASYGSDDAGRPAVHLALDGAGAARMKAYTRKHVGEQLAIVLLERDWSEVISAPRIESELHARFLIHGGGMDVEEATELALLLRSGSLAAPMEIVEERTVGPSLGADNIRRGLNSVAGGFALVAVLIAGYYMVFGGISVFALLANLLCLTALLAALGAALTLPGLAGFALTIGMAIDANVLINERIREELAAGSSPGLAIESGYARAFATILDANMTTLIAGLALFALGSGPVRGFAVVLCLGIATSMFTALMVTRSLADLVYGRRPGRLKSISIG